MFEGEVAVEGDTTVCLESHEVSVCKDEDRIEKAAAEGQYETNNDIIDTKSRDGGAVQEQGNKSQS